MSTEPNECSYCGMDHPSSELCPRERPNATHDTDCDLNYGGPECSCEPDEDDPNSPPSMGSPYVNDRDDENQPHVDADPDVNWRNNNIQFPRLLAELEAAGILSYPNLRDVASSMDLDVGQVREIVDRAQATWDAIKERTGR